MKSYEEYQQDLLVESDVDPKQAQAWKNFIRAAQELKDVLNADIMTLHRGILGDIDHHIEIVQHAMSRFR